MKGTLLAALLLALPAAASAALQDIEVYGTSTLTDAELKKLEPKVKRYLYLDAGKTKATRRAAESQQKELESEILKLGGFAYARMQKVAAPKDGGVVVVFDVVENGAKDARMPFRAAPAGFLPDPAGLLAAWKHYYNLGWDLARRSAISADRVDCPAFYCTWGAATPELGALQDQFIEKVPKNKDLLLQVMREDADAQKRADALVLLAYLKDGIEVSKAAELGLSDPDDRVREAAMRVFSDIIVYKSDVSVPVEKIAQVMDYPSVDDRTRALAVMLGIANHPLYRRFLLQSGSTQVLKLLRTKNSSNHEMALTALKMLSGENHDGRDYDAWEACVQRARKADLEEKK
ncbi:MAG TPA: hypothetical protein DCM05_11050 [Elusimicrobia bacterium]|nr:hypothetical protein [Elusimicrobiota bacterium]